jgi:hypothetical protein
MKFFAVLLLAASVALAGSFQTGQAARAMIGQSHFTMQYAGGLLGGVGGVAVGADTLFVAEGNRVGARPLKNRVTVFRNFSSLLPSPTAELEYTKRCPVCVDVASFVLGQDDFEETKYTSPPTRNTLRTPTAVATDGVRLAVADTDNNRVLIWNSIPTTMNQPADVVVGQPDFTSATVHSPPTATSLRAPQGVWLYGGKLFVADTLNNRVLIWNTIPTTNGKAADVVVGQKSFNVAPQVDLTASALDPQAYNLVSPVSVTTDGQRLYVADLGQNRVLIWNTIPTTNGASADVVIGHATMTEADPNDSSSVCAPIGVDEDGENLYGARCGATLDFPRFALSDGTRLFISDGGNDRVLVFNSIPTTNGQAADVILGQPNDTVNMSSDSAYEWRRASADSMRTPHALAWDGENLYVADPFNMRILVFTPADPSIPYTGVRNGASRAIHAVGSVTLAGTINAGDTVTVTIGDDDETDDNGDGITDDKISYAYTVTSRDTIETVGASLVDLINSGQGTNSDGALFDWPGGDRLVYAAPNPSTATVILSARAEGSDGDKVTLAVEVTNPDHTPKISVTSSGSNLTGGKDAAKIGPGSLVQILGDDLADQTAAAPAGASPLPTELGGVQVYFDGIRAPLLYVSPGQINAQVPFDVSDSNGVSAYVRIKRRDGRVTVTNATAVPIVGQNPGIFAFEGPEPRAAIAVHFSDRATGTVSVDGSATAGDVCTVTIQDREYSYVVQIGDTLNTIRDALIRRINEDPLVEAYPSSIWTRIRLRARVPGPAGNGIRFSASVKGEGAVLTAFNEGLCCANEPGALVTEDNPALPGETIIIYATGLGLIEPSQAMKLVRTGVAYDGPANNKPLAFVSSMAGGKTANVLACGLKPGAIGVYEIHLELNQAQGTDALTRLTISQAEYTSNIVTIPVFNFNDQ